MHRIRTQISWFIIALFISTLITTNFSIIPSVTAQTTQLFPDDISKILTANYTISQQLVHYSEGMFQGSGEVDCQFTNPTPNTDPSRIDIYANNQVFLWQRRVQPLRTIPVRLGSLQTERPDIFHKTQHILQQSISRVCLPTYISEIR